jgi:hypothetical protein
MLGIFSLVAFIPLDCRGDFEGPFVSAKGPKTIHTQFGFIKSC